jgi:hypothetical protein
VRREGPDALSPGKHTLEFDFNYDGLGAGTLAFNNVSGIGAKEAGLPSQTAQTAKAPCEGEAIRLGCLAANDLLRRASATDADHWASTQAECAAPVRQRACGSWQNRHGSR